MIFQPGKHGVVCIRRIPSSPYGSAVTRQCGEMSVFATGMVQECTTVYSTVPAQEQGARLPAMRRRRLDFSQKLYFIPGNIQVLFPAQRTAEDHCSSGSFIMEKHLSPATIMWSISVMPILRKHFSKRIVDLTSADEGRRLPDG